VCQNPPGRRTVVAVSKDRDRSREGYPVELQNPNDRLIVTYSGKRAHNDRKNREKGMKRLEKRVKSGKLKKEHINNRGYNKYLKLTGEVTVVIDYEKFTADTVWDGLKGYVTNTKLTCLPKKR
jgi:hypothetical protein